MKEIKSNLWDYYDKNNWVVITTNGVITKNGKAVMGKGIALQAKNRIPIIDGVLGACLKTFGNQVFNLSDRLSGKKIITFPTKHDWRDNSDLSLIERSAKQLVFICEVPNIIIYMPRPGCGNGGLDWKDVKSILEKYLDDRFVVVNNE